MSAFARRPRYVLHDGFRMPMGFPVEGFESGQRYRAAAGDIFVATYPKCGTTWMQYIVYLLLHGAEPLRCRRAARRGVPASRGSRRGRRARAARAAADQDALAVRADAVARGRALYLCRAQSVRLRRVVLPSHARLRAPLRLRGRDVRGVLRVLRPRRGRLRRLFRPPRVVAAARATTATCCSSPTSRCSRTRVRRWPRSALS